MDSLLQDVKYGIRMLARSPGFTTVALLTLALGIGANAAIFGVVNGVLLRPLSYPEPDQLLTLWEANPKQGESQLPVSYPNFQAWQENRSFENLAGISQTNLRLSGVEEPERLPAAYISRELLDVFRVRPALGRNFLPEEDRIGGASAVILSHSLWQRKFAGDPEIVGRALVLDGMPYPVVGVLPPGFDLPSEETAVFLPLNSQGWSRNMKNRAVHIITVVGRLRPNVRFEQAEAEMRGIAQHVQQAFPGEDPEHGIHLVPLQEDLVGSARPAILILFGAVMFVLLIACANVASLLLARGNARQKEVAIRAALGGSRWRMVRLLLTESLLLAATAGGLGLLVALWGADMLVRTLPDYLPRVREIRLDPAVFGFTFLVSLLSGIGFGLAPAVLASQNRLSEALKEGGGQGGGSRRIRGRNALVVVEVSLSLVLLAGAGLMLKSLWLVTQVNPGFRTEQLLTVPVSLPAAEYDEPPSWIRFYRELPQRLEALPGVQGVSAVNRLPISGGDSHGDFTIEGRPFPLGQNPTASYRRVLPNYFRLMGIPLRQGREFGERDTGEAESIVIINETMARRYWPQGDAIGQRIKVGLPENEPWLTIVGVVGDVHNVGLDAEPALATYEPHPQRPWSSMNLVIRTQGDPLKLAAAIRSELRAAERQLFIGESITMESRIFGSLAPRRIGLYLLGLFALLALGLAAVGTYGVMAHSVSERAREIGIRMALGAHAGDVLRMVLRQGMTLAAVGAALGLAGAFAVTRWLATLLYGVQPTDPFTFAAVTVLMLSVALLACYLPARRAARVDPMVALRHE